MIAMTFDHLSDAVDLNNVSPKSQNHERSLEYESCAFQNRTGAASDAEFAGRLAFVGS